MKTKATQVKSTTTLPTLLAKCIEHPQGESAYVACCPLPLSPFSPITWPLMKEMRKPSPTAPPPAAASSLFPLGPPLELESMSNTSEHDTRRLLARIDHDILASQVLL